MATPEQLQSPEVCPAVPAVRGRRRCRQVRRHALHSHGPVTAGCSLDAPDGLPSQTSEEKVEPTDREHHTAGQAEPALPSRTLRFRPATAADLTFHARQPTATRTVAMPALKASTSPTPAASRPTAAASTSRPTASQHGTRPPANPRPMRPRLLIAPVRRSSTSCSPKPAEVPPDSPEAGRRDHETGDSRQAQMDRPNLGRPGVPQGAGDQEHAPHVGHGRRQSQQRGLVEPRARARAPPP